jgi:hypothetical protein
MELKKGKKDTDKLLLIVNGYSTIKDKLGTMGTK